MATAIVNAAYSTEGNGGRKIVKLSNGWLVAGAWDSGSSQIKFYKSTDNGATWSLLCYSGNSRAKYFALTSSGTTIYCITTTPHPTATATQSSAFDATTILNTDDVATSSGGRATVANVDTSQDVIEGVSITIDSSGYIHAAWMSKNATYSNSFNIRYSTSIDGGSTWAAVTQVTTVNSSGYNFEHPCIVIRQDDNPAILCRYQYTTTSYRIITKYYNGSVWSSDVIIHEGNTYVQSNPCATVASNGDIQAVWQGYDATYTAKYQIKYSKSTDSGATWSAAANLTTEASYDQTVPTIAAKTSDLYVFFQGRTSGSYDQIRKISYDGSWSSITDITALTTDHAKYPAAMEEVVSNVIGYIWQDNENAAVQFDKIYSSITDSATCAEATLSALVPLVKMTVFSVVATVTLNKSTIDIMETIPNTALAGLLPTFYKSNNVPSTSWTEGSQPSTTWTEG